MHLQIKFEHKAILCYIQPNQYFIDLDNKKFERFWIWKICNGGFDFG